MKIAEKVIQILEMAQITSEGALSVWVYTEPLGNPSFHLRRKGEYEVSLQIKDFNILQWKANSKNLKEVPSADKKKMISMLNQEEEGVSYWKQLLIAWNVLNYKYKISLQTRIPI